MVPVTDLKSRLYLTPLMPGGEAPGEATPEEKELARIMNTYWTNFAKTGNPNGNGLPDWPFTIFKKKRSSMLT